MTDRSYNYSALQSAYTCLKKFKLLYVDKIKAPVPESADLHFGTAVHAGAQAFLEGQDGVEVFRAYWESEKDKDRRYGRFDWAALSNQGEGLLAKFERFHLKKFKVFKLEERIYTQIEDVRLEGTPDFVGEFEGVPCILDFKTTGYNYVREKLICNEQMPLYQVMAKQEWGYDAKQLIYFPFVKGDNYKIQRALKLDVNPEHVQATVRNVLAVCRELDKRIEFHENRASCLIGQNKCEYFDLCHGAVSK